MEKEFEKLYHNLEKDHFWFKARRKFILQIMNNLSRDKSVLDVGCSSGILLHELKDSGYPAENLYGVDISQEAITRCRDSGLKNTFLMDGQKIALDKKMDVIIASDCLEHIEGDIEALENWHSLLKDEGLLIVFVPAFKALWSDHDEVNMHFRRYTRKELKEKMRKAGFSVTKASYWNFFLFLPLFSMRALGKILKKKGKHGNTGDLQRIGKMNGILYRLMFSENLILKYINLPVGISVFCLGKKQ